MKLQKIQVAATLQQIIFDGAETKLKIIPNYFKGLFSNPDKFSIDLNFKDLQKLNYIRHTAITRGKIIESDKNLDVEANLTIQGEKYKIELSPTGQNLDMIGDPNKYAYKVTVKDGDRIYGMKEFKLIPPKSRHHIVEWIAHKIEKLEGLVVLRYDFIKLTINGVSKGIYAIEEHFNTELIENNDFREGLMFSFSEEDDIIVYNEKEVIRNNSLKSQLQLLRAKWQGFLNGDIEIGKIFDIKKYAKFYAIVDIMNGYHATSKQNLKMYLNPVTNLIEPIAREYNSLRYSDGPQQNFPIMIENINTMNDPVIFREATNKLLELFKETTFIKLYIGNLVRLSKKEYLDKLFKENENELNDRLNIIYKDEPYYSFPKEYMYLRQSYIRNKLNEKINLKSYYNIYIYNKLHVSIENKSNFPIELLEIISSEKTLYKFNHHIIFGGGRLDYIVDEISPGGSIYYNVKYRFLGLVDDNRESIIIPKSFEIGTIFPDHIIFCNPNLYDKLYLTIDENNKTITFPSSDLVIDNLLVIPKDYKVIGKPGLSINLTNNASILSYSSIEFIGSTNIPILIYSSDSTGQGIIIFEAKNQSRFNNVIFTNISNPKNFGWELPGSITVYESNIKIINTVFKKNRSEDYLNIIRSKFEISGCLFEDAKFDAFDGDFSDGLISNSTFRNCGNDAIDVSGSNLIIDTVFIDNAGDKGISIGERSELNGKNLKIQNSKIGITSKDFSTIEINDISISNTKVGFAAYQKKPEFGPGKIKVNRYELNNVENAFLIESGSLMTANGKNVTTMNRKVEEMLY